MQDFTAALVAAHRGSNPTLPPPASHPTDFASAMRVQRDVTQALGASLAGWKVGFSPDGKPVPGPLYASLVQRSPGTAKLPERGFIIEVEVAFRLSRDLPASRYTREEILAAADEALIGIELVRGRFGELPAVPYPVFLADNGGNAGYVIGDTTRDFRKLDLKSLHCRFTIDGEVVQEGDGGHPQGDPIEPLRACVEQPIDMLGGFKAGQLVTTGSLTKPLRVEKPCRIEARLDGIGGVALTLTR